eukprot:jgi/Mesvir1/8746/Mv26114-RA.1
MLELPWSGFPSILSLQMDSFNSNVLASRRGVTGSDTWQHPALEQLQGSTATGGDVGHLVREASLLDGRDGVTTADDGDHALSRELRQGLGDGIRAHRKLLKLKHAHGPVPDDALALLELIAECLDRGGADIEAHPALRDVVRGHDLALRISSELVGHVDIHGEKKLNALRSSLGNQVLGEIQLILLDQRGADALALGLVEGEDHATAQDQLVALLQQGLDHADLGGHLGASDDGAEGARGVSDGAIEVIQLLLQQVAGHGGLEELGHTGSGGVGAVGRAEGVVDVQVGVSGQLLGELLHVLLLLGVEADVFQQQNGTVGHIGHRLLDLGSDAVADHCHLVVEELIEPADERGKSVLCLLALWPAQVSGK